MTGEKRSRTEEPEIKREESNPPPPPMTAAQMQAVLRNQHREWVRGLPNVPPQREETESPVALIQGAADSQLVLEDKIFLHLGQLDALRLTPGRSRGDFKLSGLRPQLWQKLYIVVGELRSLDDERPVRVIAPKSFTSGEELALIVRVPYPMDPQTFALGLKFKENERRPTAVAAIFRDEEPLNLIKLYCFSKSHWRRLLNAGKIVWNKKKLTVEKPKNKTSRKTRRAERNCD